MNAIYHTKGLLNQSCGKIINNSGPRSIKLLPGNLKSKIIDTKGLSEMMKNDFKKKIPIIMQNFNIEHRPKIKIISVGDKIDNKIYIDNKIKACSFIGIDYEHKSFSNKAKYEEISEEISFINKDKRVNGVILQLPLSKELDHFSTDLLNQISIEKNIDGLNQEILHNFIHYNQVDLDKILFSPTALGVIQLIRLSLLYENNVEVFREKHWKYYSLNEKPIDLDGKNICLLGRGKTAGLPISLLMEKGRGNLSICDINTPKEIFEESLRKADIVISAVGKINLVKNENLKKDCLVIDVGINLIPKINKRRICGDVDFFNCIEKVKYISTVPGGVGKMTVIMLMRNVIKAWLNQNKIYGDNADLLYFSNNS